MANIIINVIIYSYRIDNWTRLIKSSFNKVIGLTHIKSTEIFKNSESENVQIIEIDVDKNTIRCGSYCLHIDC